MNVTAANLAEFVARTDALGGPGSAEADQYWQGFTYAPTTVVDVTLNPDGAKYHAQMIALYEEMSGRKLDQSVNEMTDLDVDRLVAAESPYADQRPAQRAIHYMRIAKIMQVANLPTGARVLDMGCGWGLSSELLAALGFEVTAVDINPYFVDLVNRRAKRLGLRITARQSSFDAAFLGAEQFDAVMFYECLHHAVNVKELLARVSKALRPSGVLALVGEPIQDLWWPDWGLRLDALSVYCIHKHGWFESGWSARYLRRAISASDMVPSFVSSADPDVGSYVLSRKSWILPKNILQGDLVSEDWWIESDWAVSNRNGSEVSSLTLCRPRSAREIKFEIWNFGPAAIDIAVEIGAIRQRARLEMGRNEVVAQFSDASTDLACRFHCKPWSPAEVLGTADVRRLGFHLKQIEYVP